MDVWNAFTAVLRQSSSLFDTIDFAREMHISRAMSLSGLQDPFRFRARFIGLEIASVLIDEEGKLQLDQARHLLQQFEAHRYFIGPHLENDAFLFEHIRSSLTALIQTTAIHQLLHKFSPPLCHSGAERLIHNTLWPAPIKKITSAHVKRAALAAWFTYLRQTTGSCFATAPAILIQAEQPLQLLQDLYDLLTLGALRRIVAGKQYAVPLCPSIEQFDITRPLTGFSPFALSLSPGLQAALAAAGFSLSPSELESYIAQTEDARTPKELIAAILLRLFELTPTDLAEEKSLQRLEMNPLLAKHSAVYYQKPSARASKVSQWTKAQDLATAAYQALGDCALLRAWESTLASFSDVKLDIGKWNLYVSLGLHPDYSGGIGAFVYAKINTRLAELNAQMAALQGEYEQLAHVAHMAQQNHRQGEYAHAMTRASSIRAQIEESAREGEALSRLFPIIMDKYNELLPSCFQEIFDPSLVQNIAEMIDDSPAGFRLVYKHGRSHSSQWSFIRSAEEFIQSVREFFEYGERELLAEHPIHRDAIEDVSTHLIQSLQTEEFLQQSIERVRKNPSIHDPRALPWEYISGGSLPALLMTYYQRHAPLSAIQKPIRNAQDLLHFLVEGAHATAHPALMFSPTHAFIFHPTLLPSNPAQQIGQMQAFWKHLKIDQEERLTDKLSERLPEQEAALFLHLWRKKNMPRGLHLLRASWLEILGSDKEPFVDGFLFEALPLLPPEAAESLTQELGLPLAFDSWLTPLEFREQVKIGLIARQGAPFSSIDIDATIADFLRSKGLAAPQPILFADTNWSSWLFGLNVSPTTGALELWRFPRTAMSGVPMNGWFRHQCQDSWTLFHRPQEYKL